MGGEHGQRQQAQQTCKRHRAAPAQGMMTMFGALIAALTLGVFAIDIPLYYTYQNQLQTAVNAAALAGAAYIPDGRSLAEEAVYEYAALNPVADLTLSQDNVSVTEIDPVAYTISVHGEANVPTLMARFVCALTASAEANTPQSGGTSPPPADTTHCEFMQVIADAKAVPAARDTMLVIDNSSSMGDMGNNRPLSYVKQAAIDYVTQIQTFNNKNVDRIGLVKFAYDGTLVKTLKSGKDDPSFSSLRSSINNITLYNAQGWNTNYESGLKLALNELQNNGRPNANKVILFFTDGMPNLPAPASFYATSLYQPYNRCTNMVYTSTKYKTELCTYDAKRKQYTNCPTLPSSRITYAHIPTNAHQCGLDYTNHMVNTTTALVNQARDRGITINTINIADPADTDNATAILARLRRNDAWESGLIEMMAPTTNGKAYTSSKYDATAISNNFKEVAKDIRMKLSN